MVGAVVAALTADLAKMPEDLASSALAALAMSLATTIDNPGTTPTAKSMCAGSLLAALDELRTLAPTEEQADELDDLAARRSARRAGGATA